MELGAVEPPIESDAVGSVPLIPGEPYSINSPGPNINLDYEGGPKHLFETLKTFKSSSSSSSSNKLPDAIKFLNNVQLPLIAGADKVKNGDEEPLWTRFNGLPVKKPWINFDDGTTKKSE